MKEDLILNAYFGERQNDVLEIIQDEVSRFYAEHTCADEKKVLAYLKENLTWKAIADICAKNEQVVGEAPSAKTEKRKYVRSKGAPDEDVELATEPSYYYNKRVFTKERPTCEDDEVAVSVYRLTSKLNQKTDVLYTKVKNYNNKERYNIRYDYAHLFEIPIVNVSCATLTPKLMKKQYNVINTRTNRVFSSIKEAANECGIKYWTFKNHITNSGVFHGYKIVE